MEYLEKSEEITGYRVKIRKREAFNVAGYTIIVPPGPGKEIRQFWKDVITDGRLDKLTKASSIQPWVLGLGSWDPECEKGGSGILSASKKQNIRISPVYQKNTAFSPKRSEPPTGCALRRLRRNTQNGSGGTIPTR